MKKKIVILVLSVLTMLLAAFGIAGCSKAEDLLYKAPENIAYDGQYITWSKTEGANHYTVSIDGGDAARSNSTTYAYASTNTFEVTVTAVFDNSEKSTSVTFKPLATIENITVSDNGEVSWDAVSGANAYSVSVNGTAQTVTDTRITTLPEGSNRVKVKPIVSGDNTFYSSFSQEVNVYIYGVPTNVKYDGTTVTWTGSSASYDVTINGVSKEVKGNSFAYNSENRDFTVEVKALGNYTSTYDSKSVSEEFHYLDAVTEIFVEDGIIKWNAINGAEGYKLKIGGVVQKASVTTTQYENLSSGRSQDVAVMPYNESGNYFSSWSAEKTVFILDTPVVSWNNDLELDGEANNNLTWNAVNAADGYTARLIKDGGTPEISTYSDVQRAFSHAYASVGKYTIEIKANAASGSTDYYDSKYSVPITVERLAAPKAVDSNFIVSARDNLASGFTVNFVQVNGASGYQLHKDGVLLNGKYTTNAALTDNNVADSANISEQHYTYTVRSMGGVKTVSNSKYVTLPCLSTEALSFDMTVQAVPQNPTMSGYTLSWEAVAGNNGYNVAYAGTSVTAQAESFDLSTIKAGSYSVTVSARGNGSNVLASNASAPVAIQRLEAPKNIKISASGNGTLQWDDVSNAKSYETYLGLSKTPLADNAYGNMYQFIDTDGTTLSMVAVANYYNELGSLYYMTSETSPTQQFIRLAAPTFPEGALANSVQLLWSAPSNINTSEYTPTYRIYSAIGEQIGGGDQNGTKFNIEYLQGGGNYNFYVKAIGNDTKYLDSDYSVVITAYKIYTPELDIVDGQYVWNAMTNASSYYLEIDGKKVSDDYHVSGTQYSYTPRFTTEGDHIVKLKAVGDGRGNLDSAFYTYTQKARILKAPVIEYKYSDEHYVTNGRITVTIKTQSANCSGYQYEIAGQSLTSTELTYSKVIQSPGKYSVRVKALGGAFDSNDVYYIDSQYAGGATTDVINLLAAPAESSFSITSDGAVKWDAISGSFGYEYQISYNGEGYGEVQTTGYNTFTVNNHKQYRSITVKIREKGDGNKTVASEWIEWTWTNSNPV